MFKKFRKKISAITKGDLIFTFPNGEKLYLLKDDYLVRLPNEKYQMIQENQNYLAFLGLTKTNLIAMNKKLTELSEQLKIEVQVAKRGISNLQNIENISKSIEEISLFAPKQLGEFDRANELLITNTFDFYFFFEDEDPLIKNEQTLERKRFYLKEYPFFNGFFLQILKKNKKISQDTYSESIQFVLMSATLEEIKEQMKGELTQMNLTNNKKN